jgi:[ribosomal protein S18]-alanine N-acetyltransferase
LRVRLATPVDIPAIQALEQQSATAAHWGNDVYRNLVGHGSGRIVLVADDNGAVSAFVVARVVGDEWEIENIVVAKHLRRQGMAFALICDLLERARAQSARQILLEVRPSNASARALYAKAGFSEYARRPEYYQNPDEDALCYRFKLDAISGDFSRP